MGMVSLKVDPTGIQKSLADLSANPEAGSSAVDAVESRQFVYVPVDKGGEVSTQPELDPNVKPPRVR